MSNPRATSLSVPRPTIETDGENIMSVDSTNKGQVKRKSSLFVVSDDSEDDLSDDTLEDDVPRRYPRRNEPHPATRSSGFQLFDEEENHHVVQPNLRKKPGPKPGTKQTPQPFSSKPIAKADIAAKMEIIRAIEKNWGKNFVSNYIPKCHRPLQKKHGKRVSYRPHESDPKNWLPSILKSIYMISRMTKDKEFLKQAFNDVVRYRIKRTGNRKPQLVTTDLDIIDDMINLDWDIESSFKVRYKHLLLANTQEPLETDENIDHIFACSAENSPVPSGDEQEDEDDLEENEEEDNVGAFDPRRQTFVHGSPHQPPKMVVNVPKHSKLSRPAKEELLRVTKKSKPNGPPAGRSTLPAPLSAFQARWSAFLAHQSATTAHQSATPARQSATPARQSATPARQSATPARQSATPARQSATPARQSATPTRRSPELVSHRVPYNLHSGMTAYRPPAYHFGQSPICGPNYVQQYNQLYPTQQMYTSPGYGSQPGYGWYPGYGPQGPPQGFFAQNPQAQNLVYPTPPPGSSNVSASPPHYPAQDPPQGLNAQNPEAQNSQVQDTQDQDTQAQNPQVQDTQAQNPQVQNPQTQNPQARNHVYPNAPYGLVGFSTCSASPPHFPPPRGFQIHNPQNHTCMPFQPPPGFTWKEYRGISWSPPPGLPPPPRNLNPVLPESFVYPTQPSGLSLPESDPSLTETTGAQADVVEIENAFRAEVGLPPLARNPSNDASGPDADPLPEVSDPLPDYSDPLPENNAEYMYRAPEAVMIEPRPSNVDESTSTEEISSESAPDEAWLEAMMHRNTYVENSDG